MLKKITAVLSALIMTLACLPIAGAEKTTAEEQASEPASHILVVYFSATGTTKGVAEKLAEGVTDVALIGMKPASAEISAEPFYEDSVVIITPVREPFLTMKETNAATLQKLFEEPVILREEGSGSLKAANTFLANAGYTENNLRVAARTNDPEAIKNLVVRGLGISMISSKAAEDYSRENRLLVFSFPEISGRRTLYIATRKHAALPERAKDFLRYLKQFYAER